MVKVMLVDDHPLLRRGLKQLLELSQKASVVAEANNADEALDIFDKVNPDIIVVDLNMRGVDGLSLIEQLRNNNYSNKIVVFSVSDHQKDVTLAFKKGADGYLLKDEDPESVVKRILACASGEVVVSDAIAPLLAKALKGTQETDLIDSLTARERQILEGIAKGKSNKEIGRDLDIAENTVKVHVKSILRKLKLRTRVDIAIWATEHYLRR